MEIVTEENRAEILARRKRRAKMVESELLLYPVVMPDGSPSKQELDVFQIVDLAIEHLETKNFKGTGQAKRPQRMEKKKGERSQVEKENLLEKLRIEPLVGESVPEMTWRIELTLPVTEPDLGEGRHVHSLLQADGGWRLVSSDAAQLFHTLIMRNLSVDEDNPNPIKYLGPRGTAETALLFEMLDYFIFGHQVYDVVKISPSTVLEMYESGWRGAGDTRTALLEYYWASVHYRELAIGWGSYYELKLYARRSFNGTRSALVQWQDPAYYLVAYHSEEKYRLANSLAMRIVSVSCC